MKTDAERQAAKRQRRIDAGEVLLQKWVPAERLDEINAAISEILRCPQTTAAAQRL